MVKPRPATSWSNYSSPRRTRSAKSTPPAERRAGTTLTGAILVEHDETPHWLVANIGDSRTYCVRDGVFEQVTVDHSQVQEYLDAGMLTAEQARVDPRRNVITRALGAGMLPPRSISSPSPPSPATCCCCVRTG